MKITPTLNFGGNCREAIKMYEKAFNGKITCLISYREANDPAYMPLLSEEQKDYMDTRVKSGIELYRKGYANLKFTLPDGTQIKNLKFKATQKSHDLVFPNRGF